MAKSERLRPGTRVRSHHNAPWTGVVVTSGRFVTTGRGWVTRDGDEVIPVYDYDHSGSGRKFWQHPDRNTPIHHISNRDCVLIKVTHDRNGRPMRKVLWKVLYYYWLEILRLYVCGHYIPAVNTSVLYKRSCEALREDQAVVT